MTHPAAHGGLGGLTDQALLGVDVVVECVLMDGLAATRAFLEVCRFVTLGEQVVVVGLNLDHLGTVGALSEHWAVSPEVQVHSLTHGERGVFQVTELAFVPHCSLNILSLICPSLLTLCTRHPRTLFLPISSLNISEPLLQKIQLCLSQPRMLQHLLYLLRPHHPIHLYYALISMIPDLRSLMLVPLQSIVEAPLIVYPRLLLSHMTA